MIIVDSTVVEDPENHFNLTVYQDNTDADEDPVKLEEFENLSMNPANPSYAESVLALK